MISNIDSKYQSPLIFKTTTSIAAIMEDVRIAPKYLKIVDKWAIGC
jgi:hypothetical protein